MVPVSPAIAIGPTLATPPQQVTRFVVMIMYMRRIKHQRNSFNNYHRMIGGMEVEERERRQREWYAWKAEENDRWERQRRKVAYRRELDDIKRGYWE